MTDKKTEALKLALEFIDNLHKPGWGNQERQQAITAIREALAKQPAQQEPVAWKDRTYGNLHHQDFGNSIPLYASPPIEATPLASQRSVKPWVGLTDEEIEAAMPGGIYDCLADPWDCGVGDGDYMRSIKNDVVRIVRAIEAKLKEKNQ